MKPWSLRDRLMLGILLPVVAFIAINTLALYRQALRAADVAYDRTLLATAKSIGDLLEAEPLANGTAQLKSTLLYSALEPFEVDNRSRLYYRVTGFAGETVSGFEALPRWHGQIPAKGPYAALVDFYDDVYQGAPVRVAVLLQPVTWRGGQGMATVQVAETLELRQTLARSLLLGTLWRQAALIGLIAAVVVFVVRRATRPVLTLSQALSQRPAGDLTPLPSANAPQELQPLLEATNQLMARLGNLLEHQKRFVRDASHQLRTPLAVLKTQVQSARRGDVEPQQALAEIDQTVQRATQLANQMLALAKVAQMRQQPGAPLTDWAAVTRAVALDLSALIAGHALEFDLEAPAPAWVHSHEWALRELTRNVLHNAIRHSPPGGALRISLVLESLTTGPHIGAWVRLMIQDDGPGIADAWRERLFQPFATTDSRHGCGLGLAICQDVALSLGGRIALNNRLNASGAVCGLDACIWLPLAEPLGALLTENSPA
jgi:two-component system sensor histidine kinase TctE